jgi:hypothetical protein
MKAFTPMFRYPTPSFPPLLQRQSLFPIESFYQVFPHFPALPVQQHADLPVSVPHSRLSDFSDAHPQCRPWIFMRAIAKRSSI